MTIIDGIGDEVTYFFVTIIVVLIATIAWITTDIQQNLYVRTVYLLEASVHPPRVTTLTNHTESATISEGVVLNSEEIEEVAEVDVDDTIERDLVELDEVIESDPVIDEIIETMDSTDSSTESNILRQRRLQRFETGDNQIPNILNTSTENQEISPDRIVEVQDVNVNSTTGENTSSTSPITIKLKFIDDNLKIVDAQLREPLGDFKRRHFDVELSSNKLVRLIFNGQVLKNDQQTLESYGIFDNCVVHCLVHQPRSPQPGENPTLVDATAGVTGGSNSAQTHRDWDLGNLLIATLTFTLGSAWYFRFQYPQLFTIWTTIGLIGLTSGFAVIALVRYYPEVLTRDQMIVQ